MHRNETRAKRTGEANLTQFWLKRQVSIQSLILDAFLRNEEKIRYEYCRAGFASLVRVARAESKQGRLEAEQAKAILNRLCEVNAQSAAFASQRTRAKRTGEANLTQFGQEQK